MAGQHSRFPKAGAAGENPQWFTGSGPRAMRYCAVPIGEPVMSDSRLLRSRYLTSIVLGALAALVTYLPPLHLAGRLDGKLFDLWSRLLPATDAGAIVLVTFDDPAWLGTLADRARADGAELLVTTLAHPPSPDIGGWALGPTELALGPRLLRRTDWAHGGHLWFEPDDDGVVRSENPTLGDAKLRSLAYEAHAALERRRHASAGAATPDTTESGPGSKGTPDTTDSGSGPGGAPEAKDSGPGADGTPDATAGAGDPERVSGSPLPAGRHRIRYLAPGTLPELHPEDFLGQAGLLTDRVVVAGRPTPVKRTPVGPMPEHELVAHALAAYESGSLVTVGAAGSAVPWAASLLMLWLIGLRLRSFARRRWLWPVAGGAGLVGASGVGFAALGTWVPIAAPATLLAIGSVLLLLRPGAERRRSDGTAPLSPRELLAEGRLEEAWTGYRKIPPTQAIFDELYELGRALEDASYSELAADTFYRIALVDVRFRDVARRLVRATHASDSKSGTGATDDDLPDSLGRYEILERVGQGSTGRVFLARDPEINRIVALKVIDLKAEYEPDELEEAKDGFRREAETAGRLSHPNIVTIYDVGETDGLAYIAMEYLKGRHLSDFTSPEALLPVPLVLELGARTAEALDYAHGQNVVHRDIKPSNIMYDSVSGDLKITDFGIARLIDVSRTRTGVVLGTPSFMAPEQLEGRNVNGNTDLFALGVSLYELLTGRLPFRGASMTSLMFVIANEPHEPMKAVRPDLPSELDAVIDVALSKNPDQRFLSGAEMAGALRAAARQAS